jgi:NADPH-dependent curcumin reductase CurA
MKSRQVLLASRPAGTPTPSNFRLVEVEVPDPGPGEILVRNTYMSVDPYMRGRMNEKQTYAQPWQVGQPADGRAVGEVVTSRNPDSGTSDFDTLGALAGYRTLREGKAFGCGVCGDVLVVPGFTGWYGLPKAGETLVVSAAGATGSLVGRWARSGCRVVGTAAPATSAPGSLGSWALTPRSTTGAAT